VLQYKLVARRRFESDGNIKDIERYFGLIGSGAGFEPTTFAIVINS